MGFLICQEKFLRNSPFFGEFFENSVYMLNLFCHDALDFKLVDLFTHASD